MKIALIGSTGFVGSAILKEALDRGHTVTAIARNTAKITTRHANLSMMDTDIMDTDKLAAGIQGNDIVISAYNPGWANPDIYNEYLKGAQSIQTAVKKSGVNRLIVIGGAGSLFITPGQQIVDMPGFPEAWKPGAAAARDYLNIIQKENTLSWTFLSPAVEMRQGTEETRKGVYRTGLDNPVFDDDNRSVISVEDLALAVIDEAELAKHIRQRFTVAY